MFANKSKVLVVTYEQKRLIANILSLGAIQGANYVLPLLTVPYLVRVLGPDYFGLIAFSTATIAYFGLMTDYGFNLSATQQVSINRGNRLKIVEIFNSVLIVKATLMFVSFIVLLIVLLCFDKFNQNWPLYLITFSAIVGQVLTPIWLFQGMERMKYIAYLEIAAKLFFTLCVFAFVDGEDDYLLVPAFASFGAFVSGFVSLFLARKIFRLYFSWQSFEVIRYQVIEGWHVFLSTISISLYTTSMVFILGIFTNNMIVGYFSSAFKILQAVKGLYTPVSQAIYPLISKRLSEDRASGLAYVKKFKNCLSIIMFFISAGLYFFSESIVLLLLGDQYRESVVLLRIMAVVPFFVVLSNVFGMQIMLNLGYKKQFSQILFVSAIIGFFAGGLAIYFFKGVGAAASLLIVEVFVTLYMYIYLRYWKKIEC